MKQAKRVIVVCLTLLAPSLARAGNLKTTVTVLQSLDTTQTYAWYAPGYASTNCTAQASGSAYGYASDSYGSATGSASGSANCQTYSRPAASGTATITGYVLYLRMPDSRIIAASCDKRINWTDVGGGWYRDCRYPQCTTCDAVISGEKVRISWPVSLDGSKRKSETYKIQSVLEPKASN